MNNIPECERTVIPNVEWSPERVYCKDGAIVTCYKITECNTHTCGIRETIIIDEANPIFAVTFVDEQTADAIMEDLYQGEYTGA